MKVSKSIGKWPVTQEMKDTVLKVLENHEYVAGGKQEIAFQEEFAEYIGSKYAIVCSSGGGGLHIALSVLGVGPGDEVITAANTYTCVAGCATWLGAKPVLVDMDPETNNIDPFKLEDKVTSKTKVIIPVHMYGHPADMDPIIEIAEKNNIFVVEDVAQAAGSSYKGKKSGSIGHMNIFAFNGKSMHCYGTGGMITTDDDEYYRKSRLFRKFGHLRDGTGDCEIPGYNYELLGWNTALGRISLRELDKRNKRRREIANMYDDLLGNLSDVETPVEKDWAYHVYLHYVLKAEKRDELIQYLEKKDIIASKLYHLPIHLQTAFKKRFGFKEGMYPISEESANKTAGLPNHFTQTEEEIHYVADHIKEFYQK
jgi:dTDP-4-amino-4,6-dideoxygalactose transaminase